MAKRVDTNQRRSEIVDAVVRLAERDGLAGVTFREVAAEADISVALVQYYFGSKQDLLMSTVDAVSTDVALTFQANLAALGEGATSIDRLRVIASTFLPHDDASRRAMVFYYSVGVIGMTDAALQGPDVHRSTELLIGTISAVVAGGQAVGEIGRSLDPTATARLVVALATGLSQSVLLANETLHEASAHLDAFLELLRG